jgi:hypothetical protein
VVSRWSCKQSFLRVPYVVQDKEVRRNAVGEVTLHSGLLASEKVCHVQGGYEDDGKDAE